jgi:YbgC/YbaW family acyl-CoA thioester hydrolase
MPYEFEWKVRAADTDFSGLLYTPAVLDYSIRAINQLMESFDFAAYQLDKNDGVIYPTRRAEVEYHEPVSAGDLVIIEVTPRIENTSVVFTAKGYEGDRHVFDAVVTMVFVDAETVEPVPVPEAVHSGLDPYTDA